MSKKKQEHKVELTDDFFDEICKKVLDTFYTELDDKIFSKLTSEEMTEKKPLVFAGLLNSMVVILGDIYFNVPRLFPNTPIDFHFLQNKLSQSLSKTFDNIKNYYEKHQKKDELLDMLSDDENRKNQSILGMH